VDAAAEEEEAAGVAVARGEVADGGLPAGELGADLFGKAGEAG